MPEIPGRAALLDSVGCDLGSSRWVSIDPPSLEGFASSTGTPMAPGSVSPFYLVARAGVLMTEVITVRDRLMGLNYGLDVMHLRSPVQPGERIRLHVNLQEASRHGDSVDAAWRLELEASSPRRSVATLVVRTRYLFNPEGNNHVV